MSWDSYIDSLVGYSMGIDGSYHINKGCIIGKDGSKWTSDAHAKQVKLSPIEAANIAKCFKAKDFSVFQASGIRAEEMKYQFLRQDEDAVMGKMKGHGSLTMQSTKTAVVIGHCPEGGQQGICNKAVATMAEYLISLNM